MSEGTPTPKLGPKSKSILLQVAFKAAVDLEVAGKNPEGYKLSDSTDALFAMLLAKHQDHGAGDEPRSSGGYRKGGGGGGGNFGTNRPNVELDGVRYYDNDSKKGQRYFKSVDKIDAGDHKLVFEGSPEYDLLVQVASGGAPAPTQDAPTNYGPDEAPF